jgi:hypothetical protein
MMWDLSQDSSDGTSLLSALHEEIQAHEEIPLEE